MDGTVFSYYDALAGCVLTLLAGAAFAFLGAIIFGNPAPNLLVTFTQAFVLRGADGIQPPGTYLIETVEEPLDSVSFLGYRRVSTTITLPAVGTATLSKQVIAVSPQELKTGSINDGALAKSSGTSTVGAVLGSLVRWHSKTTMSSPWQTGTTRAAPYLRNVKYPT